MHLEIHQRAVGRSRIPDLVDGNSLVEVKNVRYQAYAQQLKDDLAMAGNMPGGSVTVVLPMGAWASGPLQAAFDNPRIPIWQGSLPW
jgi:hypothetical protein